MNPSKPMRIGSRAARLAAGLLAAIILGETARAADPILHYTFNTPGTNAPSTGTDSTPLYIYTAAGVCTDLHGGPGSGTTGQPGDRCLDFSSATGMGGGSTGPLARHLADVDSIDDMMSFTLTGWFKTSYSKESIANYARFFSHYGAGWGWELAGGGTKSLSLGLWPPALPNAIAPNNAFDDANKWIFFAVSYDGTATTNNVRFYRGYLNDTEAEARPSFTCVSSFCCGKGFAAVC